MLSEFDFMKLFSFARISIQILKSVLRLTPKYRKPVIFFVCLERNCKLCDSRNNCFSSYHCYVKKLMALQFAVCVLNLNTHRKLYDHRNVSLATTNEI